MFMPESRSVVDLIDRGVEWRLLEQRNRLSIKGSYEPHSLCILFISPLLHLPSGSTVLVSNLS